MSLVLRHQRDSNQAPPAGNAISGLLDFWPATLCLRAWSVAVDAQSTARPPVGSACPWPGRLCLRASARAVGIQPTAVFGGARSSADWADPPFRACVEAPLARSPQCSRWAQLGWSPVSCLRVVHRVWPPGRLPSSQRPVDADPVVAAPACEVCSQLPTGDWQLRRHLSASYHSLVGTAVAPFSCLRLHHRQRSCLRLRFRARPW